MGYRGQGHIGVLRRRLHWGGEPDSTWTSEDRAVMARTYVYLFGLGATVALATLLLSGDPNRNEIGIALAALAAYGATATCLIGYDRLPNWVFESMPPLGTVCATGVVLAGGAAGATAYAGFYFWVVFAAFSFLTLRAAIVNLAFVAIAYGLALEYLDPSHPGLRWLMALATLSVAGLLLIALRGRVDELLLSLRRRVDQQDAIALIGKRALTAGDFGELMESTAAKVAEVLGVERAAVLGLPDGRSLMYRTGVGWDRDAARSATVPLDDPLAGQALIARGPVLYESEEEPLAGIEPRGVQSEPDGRVYRGAAAAIRSHEDTLGVLVAYGIPRHRFTESDGRFLQAAANVIAEAIRRQELEQEARRQVLYDPVTERPNRALFMDRLGEALLRAERDGTTLAVYIVELEEFKIINDSYGDLFGNALLRAFATRLRRPLYLADTVARMGGPEFAVLCEGLEAERGAIEIAEQLGAEVQEPFEIGGERIRVSAATGVALSEPGATSKDLVARADAALYKARARELGGYELFDDELRQRLRYRVSLSHALARPPTAASSPSPCSRSSRSSTAASAARSAYCAGTTPSADGCRRSSSSRWRSRPARSSSSARGSSARRRGWPRRCASAMATRRRCRSTSTSRLASSHRPTSSPSSARRSRARARGPPTSRSR